ncbi:hypothetical protein BDQ94DRAFT_185032 [Aspergillus welwitschiae]|uniref:Uncharacterized protein n=1 Tax=Aspergillus welwitschiae TaxID=1341132 RepID=A0A3F3PKG2_9EURO|nr:hypothetical protein BDQ94DRAFT_185032 [Aspergillus welwitschiae]RDH27293.1 hypothetical protein BDQ94DRAFT_185032 [Aspergillus welwitschiae]
MQKNKLTGTSPPAEIKGSRAPSRKPKTYSPFEKAQHESQRLEPALWSQNHAGSMWVLPQTLRELSNLRQLCRLQSNALVRARRLAESGRNRPLTESMDNMEAPKCDRCETRAMGVVLAPCFHSLCPGCGGTGPPGASDVMFQTCPVCSLSGFQQPRRT